jgi:hypothetical protein
MDPVLVSEVTLYYAKTCIFTLYELYSGVVLAYTNVFFTQV